MRRFFAPRRFRRLRSGRIAVLLADQERELLRNLGPQLEALLDTDDPSLRRLFPTAYHDDPDADAEYRRLMADELVASRRRALETLAAHVDATEIDPDELAAWSQAVNALRLVLGTRLDVSEEDEPVVDPDDPEAPARVVYHLLGIILDDMVRALSADLP